MSRRSSSTNRIDSGISRKIGSDLSKVIIVADNIEAVLAAASVDLEALLDALTEATDFAGITVVPGTDAHWDPITKVLTVPTIKGDKGDTGEDLRIVSITPQAGGTFTWEFSDGTTYTTPNLRGHKGDKGDDGDKGDSVELASIDYRGEGVFVWSFSDGTVYQTPSLKGTKGDQGDQGDKGDQGDPITMDANIYQGSGVFLWKFSDGSTFTTPDLRGVRGFKGDKGDKGDQGVSVNHLRPTGTTDPHGDLGTFGELDTYTFYGDVHETIVLGWFKVRNGIRYEEIEPLGLMRRAVYDTNDNGVVDNSERLEGATLSDVESFVTDRTGDTSLLTTDATNLTDSVNELDSSIGDLDSLITSSPDLVEAINTLDADIGNVPDLSTDSTNLVDAVNELNDTKYDKTGGTVSGSVTINGDLSVNGTTFTVNTEEVLVTDNILVLNNGEVGTGVTKGTAGIRIDRGTSADYLISFDEASSNFRIGEEGGLQAVATREDNPLDTGIAVWDSATVKFTTSRSIDVDSVNGRDITEDGAKLDTIETGATADQTAEEIESLYESLPDTNKFTDADKSFLSSGVSLDTVATTLPDGVNELHSELDSVIAGTTDIVFDNTVSGLSALTVKAAIDEVKDGVDNNSTSIGNMELDTTATDLTEAVNEVKSGVDSNSTSIGGMVLETTATNLTDAVNEIKSGVDSNSANIGNMELGTTATDLTAAINEVLEQSTDHVNDPENAHQASAISYDNSTSGIIAEDVQSALDEIEARVDLADEHRESTGEDHTFIDQDVTTTGTPRFNSVQFNGGTGTQGTVAWNVDEETLDLVMNGATLQIGQEFVVNVRNASGTLIPNGTPVMFVGALGASGRILVLPMDSTDRTNLKRFIGLTTTDIPAGMDGKATQFGKIREIDTTGGSYGEVWGDGDVVYLDPVVPNGLTNVEPTKDKMDVPVAVVIDTHSSNGTLFVRALPLDRNINNKASNILVDFIEGVEGNDLQEILQDMRTTTVVNYNELESNAVAMAIALG